MENSIIGAEVDGYRIQELLGRGGMGVVYKAEDVALSRDVALKRIAPSMANDESFLRRFRSEAQALARIDSPYIVSVHALRQTEVGLLIVMEFVEGGTVKDLIAEGPIDWQDALPLIKQMLRALEHAHGAEVIHRDVKPENVMLSTTRTVKVTDFGLAKVHRGDSRATVTQGVHGTLHYMSPEQVQGSTDLDHRSDLYSLGMTVYEMLVGDLPFDEDSNEFEKMRTIVEEELPPPDEVRPQVPQEISALVMKALEKDPDDRFQSAEAMREAFEAFEKEYGEESSAQSTVKETPTRPAPTETPTRPASAEAPAHPTSQESPSEPSSESEPQATPSSTRWPLLAGAAALVLLLAGGGYMVFAGGALFGGGSGPPTTQLSVSTEPTGAAVFLEDQQIGTTPLPDTTIEGRTARVRVQKAGFVPRDTTLAELGNRRQVSLGLSLTREQRTVTLRSDPEGAQVSVDGEDLGSTPTRYTTREGTLRVQMRHEGYVSGETRLAIAQLEQDEFEMQLEPRSRPNPPGNDNGGGSNENPSTGEDAPTYGTLTLAASPSSSGSSVTVDGESRGTGESIRVRAGTSHQVRISHPQYGHCDTTLTVEAEETQALTCYFEHQVVVRSDPWAQIFLDGENTGESTNHRMRLKTGRTYEIKTRILSRPHEVTGGTFRRVAAESYEVLTEEEFQGNAKRITLRPSFERVTYGLEFRTAKSESSQ